MEIRESQIEDVLVSAPELTKNILKLADEPRLLARQMLMPSGKLDLLYTHQSKLLLIELKVVTFHMKFVKQVMDYREDLLVYQAAGKLLQGDIVPYLLCTAASDAQKNLATSHGISCSEYKPDEVLKYFYENFRPIAYFSEVKPIDIGIWNLHLIHDFIYYIADVKKIDELRAIVGGSAKTLYNKIKFASEMRLINWTPNTNTISLSRFGKEYVARKDEVLPTRLSEGQVQLLRKFIMQDPYESSVILGIASVVESVFALAKNTYPVPMGHLVQYFSYYAGKHFDWQTQKAKYHGAKMYSNYAVDLGLLAKSGDCVYLTPEGFRFTVQMQLHKSLKLVDAMRIS